MSLQQRCLNEFLPGDRERGAAYFNRRRVSLGAREEHGIAATVEGSGGAVYEVRLDWSRADHDGRLGVHCDCPRFVDTFNCKHLWATLVAFDRAQFTEPVPGRGPLKLIRVAKIEPAPEPEPPEPLEPEDDPASAELFRYDELLGVVAPAHGRRRRRRLGSRSEKEARLPAWRRQLRAVRSALSDDRTAERPARAEGEACFRINVARCFNLDQMVVDLYWREPASDGGPGPLQKLDLNRRPPSSFADPVDRELLRLFESSPTADHDPYAPRFRSGPMRTRGAVPAVLYDSLLPKLCATGRFGWVDDHRSDPASSAPLEWDGDEPWRFVLELGRDGDDGDDDDDGGTVRARGLLRRGEENRSLAEPVMMLANGVVMWRHRISRLDVGDEFPWISMLRRDGDVSLPEAELDLLLEDLADLPELPELEMPDEWRWGEASPEPRPRLSLRPAVRFGGKTFEGEVSFDYDGFLIAARRRPSTVFDRRRRRLIHRDRSAERAARRRLETLCSLPATGYPSDRYDVRMSERAFLAAIEPLLAEGWWVEAEDRRVLPAEGVSLSVATSERTGPVIDWFELRGEARFTGSAEAAVELPRLLDAVRRGERMIRLGDGSQGMLPEAWLERFGPLARLAQDDDADAIRYLPSQATLLDAMLAAEPEVDVDRAFARVRDRLRSFDRVEPAAEPRGFHGELRGYQRDGLGWLKFLCDLGLGGCLADDMGLGKTVQVLALVQARRLRRISPEQRRPTLIVAPRSVVHNWLEEAARFTPRLKTLAYSGPGRAKLLPELPEHHLVVTTYGLLRRDVGALKEVAFDLAVLDEAQAIKNASSQGAKAARLLSADHRLALTGTPVENHLGELWSIFEFLNPGMLGRLPAFKDLKTAGAKSSQSETEARGRALAGIAAALKPFILRRTKDQVLRDLPAKTEQTLYCDLDARQWRLYRELRDHYRAALDKRIESQGLGRAKIHVLEALLRLRQAACHPGLVDPTRKRHGSAKLETLLEQLDEVLDEGHKALVFSQFVSLLAIVKDRLEARGTPFEYLDGKTRDRRARVDRFQNDPDCRLFLISLKAGGLGLNLTAADYVFILDPWWNPAVEAQAVDRAHRIGQTRPVFAYRLIARRTVEEKILELQQSKRELADAILSASGGVIQNLTAEDLRLLLS